MTHSVRKIVLTAICSLMIVSTVSVPLQAGIVPDVWHALFGPPGTPWFPRLAPGYRTANYGYANYGHSSYYRPFGYAPFTYQPFAYSQPACAPCNPCGITNCGSNCAVNYGPQAAKIDPKPQPNGDVPKTYLEPDDSNSDTEKTPTPNPGDTNFEPKDEEAKGFGATRESEKENELEFKEPKQREVNKIPENREEPKSAIPDKKPAPSKGPSEEQNQDAPDEKSSKNQATTLNLDHKIAWRSVPRRSRLVIHSRLLTPVVARTQVNPNRGWSPRPVGTSIAKN